MRIALVVTWFTLAAVYSGLTVASYGEVPQWLSGLFVSATVFSFGFGIFNSALLHGEARR